MRRREKALIYWGDKRFADPAWNHNPFCRRYLQGYLASTNALDTFIESTGLDGVARQRGRFIMSLLVLRGRAGENEYGPDPVTGDQTEHW